VPVQAQILMGLPHGFRLKPGPGVDYTSTFLGFLNSALHVSAT
jgi:hypothetical protein